MIAAPDLSAIELHVPLPVMHRARQTFAGPVISDVEGETRQQVRRFAHTIKPGGRIAITAGSRGIANVARIIKAMGEEVRALGADPFVMPAMGSHGKATAEGQVEMLAELGVTEATTGLDLGNQTLVVNTAGTTVTALGVTAITDGDFIQFFAVGTTASPSYTPPSGMTERVDSSGTTLADKIQAAAGGTGNQSATGSLSARTIAILVAVKPRLGWYMPLMGVG